MSALFDLQHAWWRTARSVAQRAEPTLAADEAAALSLAKVADAVGRAGPAERWHGLTEVLMAPHPSHGLRAWRVAGLLGVLLPEVEGLFGVPQLSDAATAIDVGRHQLALLDECARVQAPLAVRFAALAHKIGKAGTPRDIWPSHYKHEQRAHAALDRWAVFLPCLPRCWSWPVWWWMRPTGCTASAICEPGRWRPCWSACKRPSDRIASSSCCGCVLAIGRRTRPPCRHLPQSPEAALCLGGLPRHRGGRPRRRCGAARPCPSHRHGFAATPFFLHPRLTSDVRPSPV